MTFPYWACKSSAADGQAADPLAGGGEDGVGHGRGNRRHAGLADAAHLVRAGHDVDFHGRHFVHAQHRDSR